MREKSKRKKEVEEKEGSNGEIKEKNYPEKTKGKKESVKER